MLTSALRQRVAAPPANARLKNAPTRADAICAKRSSCKGWRCFCTSPCIRCILCHVPGCCRCRGGASWHCPRPHGAQALDLTRFVSHRRLLLVSQYHSKTPLTGSFGDIFQRLGRYTCPAHATDVRNKRCKSTICYVSAIQLHTHSLFSCQELSSSAAC